MKLHYYTFTLDGEVKKEIITARRNKYSFAVGAYTEYGGREHKYATKLERESENKIIGETSTFPDGCYMYSSEISEITDGMKDFAKNRAEIVNKIIELEKEIQLFVENLKISDLGK